MYYFDFHTHAFSEKIAEKAMASLAETSGITPKTNGTVSDLLKKCDEYGIEKVMILPIATKPAQQSIINSWAKEIMNERVYAYGSVHPDAEDALDELEHIKQSGLFGVKLHPEYQLFYPDDEKLFPIYEKACELKLPVVFHGGYDPLSPDIIRGTPERFAAIARVFPNLQIIVAHLGGDRLWDDVEKHLAGKFDNVYFDIAVIADDISDEQAQRIIKTHGADRILFGSDIPWDNPLDEVNLINRIELTDEERELIFYKNAEKLIEYAM